MRCKCLLAKESIRLSRPLTGVKDTIGISQLLHLFSITDFQLISSQSVCGIYQSKESQGPGTEA